MEASKIETIKLEPGSLVILTYPADCTGEELQGIAQQVQRAFPESQPILVIPEGYKLQVMNEKLLNAAGLALIYPKPLPPEDYAELAPGIAHPEET